MFIYVEWYVLIEGTNMKHWNTHRVWRFVRDQRSAFKLHSPLAFMQKLFAPHMSSHSPPIIPSVYFAQGRVSYKRYILFQYTDIILHTYYKICIPWCNRVGEYKMLKAQSISSRHPQQLFPVYFFICIIHTCCTYIAYELRSWARFIARSCTYLFM